LYGLRYGTLPLVRRVGGLADTVVDAGDSARATGFTFDAASSAALEQTIDRAIAYYRQPAAWATLVQRAMAQDFSWDGAAQAYLALYAQAVQARQRTPRVMV
jgi:starch synthase